MSAAVRAARGRVWRALTHPGDVVGWDAANGNRGAIDVPADYPKPGQSVRWRYHLGGVPTLLEDRPIEVVHEEKLRALLALGPLALDQTWTLLADAPADSAATPRTRIALKIAASSAVAVVGGVIDRFEMRRLVTERIGSSLTAIQHWCERGGD